MTTSIAIGAAAALAISAAPAFAASSAPAPTTSPSVTSAIPAPKNVVATPGNGRITLTWSAPKSGNSIIIPDYSLLWGPTGGSLTVFKDGKSIGSAEVAYRDSMIAFPFKAVKFVSEEKAFGVFA